MIQFIYYFIILFCFLLIGSILIPAQNEESAIFNVPIIGAGSTVVVCFFLSYLGMNFENISRVFALFGLIVVTILIKVVRVPFGTPNWIKQLWREDLLVVLFCALFSSIPICLYALWGAQFPYGDGYTYISIADYLLENGYNSVIEPDTMVSHPWLSQIYLYQTNHFRIGAQMILSLFTGLFRRMYSIELFLPCTCAGIFLYGMAALSIVKRLFPTKKMIKFITVVICCVNTPITIWLALYGFMPQIWGSAFFLIVISRFIEIEQWREKGNYFKIILEISIEIAGLCFVYNEMLPFLVLGLFSMLVYKYIVLKLKRKEIILNTLICTMVSLIIVGVYLPGMISAIWGQMGAVVGWDIPYNCITYLGYILSLIPPEYNIAMDSVGGIILSIIIIIIYISIIISGIRVAKNKQNIKRYMIYFALLSIVYIFMAFYFGFITVDPWNEGKKGNSWSLFKLIQYYSVILLPFIGIFVSYYYERYKKIGRIVIALFTLINIGYALGYMASLAQSMQNYTGNENAPLAEYYQLEEKYRNITEPIELQNLPVKHRQMVTYFLRDHELISDWSSDVYFGTIPSSPEKTTPSLLLYYTTSDRNTIANLKEIEKSDETILFDFQEGFYEEENYVESKLRWSQENSSLKLYNYTGKKIEVSFVCTSATEKGGKLLIETSNGEKMIDVDISPKKQEIVFEVDPNEEITKLFFTFYGESTVPDETDGRIRAFSIQNWEGEVIE